jgi:DNA-binding MarR family transcriptional regulator
MGEKPDFDHRRLDDVLTSRIRLAMVSALATVDEMEFTVLRDLVGATDGNMTTHTKRLEEAGYIEVEKRFVERKPCTSYRLTEKGRASFAAYVEELGRFIGK